MGIHIAPTMRSLTLAAVAAILWCFVARTSMAAFRIPQHTTLSKTITAQPSKLMHSPLFDFDFQSRYETGNDAIQSQVPEPQIDEHVPTYFNAAERPQVASAGQIGWWILCAVPVLGLGITGLFRRRRTYKYLSMAAVNAKLHSNTLPEGSGTTEVSSQAHLQPVFSGKRRKSSVLPLKAWENYQPQGLDPEVRKFWELEDPIEIEGKVIDVHDWITLPWDADCYKSEFDVEHRTPIVATPYPDPEPMTFNDRLAEKWHEERRKKEQAMWDEARSYVGEVVPYPMFKDPRMKPTWDEKTDWTEEEIKEWLGPMPEEATIEVLNPFATYHNIPNDLPPLPGMVQFLRSEGMLLDDSDRENEVHEFKPGDEEPENFIGDETWRWMQGLQAAEIDEGIDSGLGAKWEMRIEEEPDEKDVKDDDGDFVEDEDEGFYEDFGDE